jgi:ATP-dependent DNA helicase RecG
MIKGRAMDRHTVESLLKQILAGRPAATLETEQLDFKLAKPVVKEAVRDLAEAAVCFANGAGGTLIVGVRDQPGGDEAVVGTDLDVVELRRQVYETTNPGLVVTVAEHFVDQRRLLIITVPEGIDVHSTSKGYATRRLGTSCLPMTPADIARLADDRRGADWSSAASDVPIGAVEEPAMNGLRRLLELSERPAARHLGRGSQRDLLVKLSLSTTDGLLTRAGQLLLMSSDRDLVSYQYRPTRSGEATTSRRWSGPIVLAFEDILDTIVSRQSMIPLTLRSGVQVQLYDYPPAAVREALANALVHGDHRLSRPVLVEHSPEALSIVSPGPLVAGVTTQTILTSGSRARFASLVGAFRHLGLAEELGQGINRMYREMLKSGRDTPTITDRGDAVEVVFRGQQPNARVAAVIHGLPEDEQADTDALLILHLLCARPSVDAAAVAPVIQRPVDDAQAALRRLGSPPVELIEPTRGTVNRRHPSYRLRPETASQLGPALAYRRKDRAELDTKVAHHVNEYGYINNSTVQRLFDVDVYAARDMLQDLVGRELLVRISEQKRGTAVRYGPGPRFPQPKRRRK